MSYFSIARLEQCFSARQRVRELSRAGAAYSDHELVWQLFRGNEGGRDFVFRRRNEQAGLPPGQISFYIVSQVEPQPVPGLLRVDCKPYDPMLQTGEFLSFQLRANPVIALKREGTLTNNGKRPRSFRHDVLMDAKRTSTHPADRQVAMTEAASNWLLCHAEKWGIQIDPEALFTDAYTQHALRTKGREIRFSTLDYAGVGTVTDPALLRKAMLGGVGRERAFGCGLLLVRRLV